MCELLFTPRSYFPQCHASCLLPVRDGRMLCVYFAGEREKANDVAIFLSEYVPASGWLTPRCVAKLSSEPHWNPVIFPVEDGIRLVFKVGMEIRAWRSYTMLSRDGGRTWSQPHPYADNPAGGPVRSKPLRLMSGALLAPNSDEDGFWQPRVDLSEDEGVHFTRLSPIPINRTDPQEADYIPGRGAIQPTLWESAPWHVHALLRTSGGYIYLSDSCDGGRSWERARRTSVPNNNSGIDVQRAPDGRLFLALNPVSGDFAARTPLCIYESTDNGETFSPFAVVNDTLLDPETGKSAEFSYPSLVLLDGVVHLSYTWNRRSIAYWCHSIG